MSAFDYGLEAGLFSSKCPKTGSKSRQKFLGYRRFARAADAIRFVMEDIPSDLLQSCSLEVDEATYEGAAIRGLYESSDFPLPRHAKPSKQLRQQRRKIGAAPAQDCGLRARDGKAAGGD